MNYWVRFWVIVLSLGTGVAALGYLFLSFLVPDAAPFAVGSGERLLIALVGTAAIGVVVWTATTFDGTAPGSPPGGS